MNKDELKELAATLNGIADGKAWEWQSRVDGEWKQQGDNDPLLSVCDGYKIRLKPWQLPQPPDGMRWHRDDWTEKMLPDGYRPLLLGERIQSGDEGIAGCVNFAPFEFSIGLLPEFQARTKRPLPQPQQPDPYEELKAAHAVGKKLQHRHPGDANWRDCSVTDTSQDPYCFLFEPECYRIKPEQQKVPLGPEIIESIQSERIYQERKWPDHQHSVAEWLLIIEKLMEDARRAWVTGHGDSKALHEIRQIVATGVACMEQCGITYRERHE